MKEKFFKSKGEIAFRIWMFLLALKEFKKQKNQEKLDNLYTKVTAFSVSELVLDTASEEEVAALEFIKKELHARGACIKV